MFCRQISYRPRKKNKVLSFILGCLPLIYAIHLNYKHCLKNENPDLNFVTVMLSQSFQQSLKSELEKNENHIYCLQRMFHDVSHSVRESKQCKQMIDDVNSCYLKMIGDGFELANPNMEFIGDSTKLKIGASNHIEIPATVIDIEIQKKKYNYHLKNKALVFVQKQQQTFSMWSIISILYTILL